MKSLSADHASNEATRKARKNTNENSLEGHQKTTRVTPAWWAKISERKIERWADILLNKFQIEAFADSTLGQETETQVKHHSEEAQKAEEC